MLASRPARVRDPEADALAGASLLEEMARPENDVLTLLAETALRLCGAESAGVSLLESANGTEHFRWAATSGRRALEFDKIIPRYSPCGLVVDRGEAVLLAWPEHHFHFPDPLSHPVQECLLLPFRVEDRIAGTLWVVAHEAGRSFDLGDVQVLANLCRCAAVAYRMREERARMLAGEARVRGLLGEMRHRLKNQIAVVPALASQTAAHEANLPDFLAAFDARLFALARASDVPGSGDDDSVRLEALVRSQVGAFGEGRIDASGPVVSLKPAAAQVMALALHELATNAAKYGALSNENGRVALGWQIESRGGAPVFAIAWEETGGPVVVPPKRRGFGSTVCKKMVEASLGGSATFEYRPEGLVWRYAGPVEAIEG